MTTVLHGENTIQSRQKLVELMQTARAQGVPVITLSGSELQVTAVELALGSDELFASKKMVLFEGLHSLPVGQRRKALLALVATHHQHNSSNPSAASIEVVLWEKRSLTATMLKPFAGATVTECKVSSVVFGWLDSLSPAPTTRARQITACKKAVETEDPFLCLNLLARQIRLLITLKSGGEVAGPPFVKQKLASQARLFSLSQLIAAHQRLLLLDEDIKTSQHKLPLSQLLERWHLQLTQK